MEQERKLLDKALASAEGEATKLQLRRAPKTTRNIGFGRIQKMTVAAGSTAAYDAVARSTMHDTLGQLVAEVEKVFGKDMPEATKTSLDKINQVLKEKFLPPDVKDNIRARLQEIQQTLAGGLQGLRATSNNFVAASSEKMTAGLGLSQTQRVALEQRISQVGAHGGMVPAGPAALGMVVVHVHGVNDPNAVADAVIKKIQKVRNRQHPSTRGRNAGQALGFS